MKKIDTVYLAKQNIKMKKFRSLGIVVGIAISSATLFTSIILLISMQNSLELGLAQLGADIIVVPKGEELPLQGTFLSIKPSTEYISKAYEAKILGIEGVQSVFSRAFVETANAGCCFKPGIFIIGFDAKRDSVITPWIKKQIKRDLQGLEVIAGSGYDWIPGIKVNIYGFPFTIAATIPQTGVEYFDKAIFMPLESLYWLSERSKEYDDIVDIKLRRGEVSAIFVQVEPGQDPKKIAERLNFYFPELRAYSAKDFVGNVKKQMFTLVKGLVFLSAFTWVTALILVGVILSVTVSERKREFGILRAMGASKRFIFGEIMVEAYLLATVGSIVGMFVGYAFLLSFKNYLIEFLKMPYLLPSFLYVGIVSILIIDISLFLSTLASFYPAYRSAEMEPYEAIRAGEL